ncbi:MAG: aspartyl/asparaginyl beta-hydroxylase domain-containing protein [Oligoflexia bacterium]|nr:aspartyl/asparaginyl beta-hydroxylase domain-containing protein [Oligoflexia bacterium]
MSKKTFLQTKRNRVSGSGPDRKILPNFHCVGKLNKKIRQEILEIVDTSKNINDLYTDNYNISKFCDLRKQLPKNHINILLQKPLENTDGMNEKEYLVYDKFKKNSLLKQFLQNRFPKHYRARIAILPPNSEINWHIDMNTSVSCRFHILVKNSNIIFEINRKGCVDRIPFQESFIYFTNTAYPHRVCNPTNKERISLLFDIEYNNIKNLLPTI